ncbi:MAG TPA: FAD:protein FMN transferase [Steroidobacteraceae bacterium]
MPATRRLRVALGTWIAIEAKAGNPLRDLGTTAPEIEQAAIEAAYAAVNTVEQAMHPHRNGSDLARINAAPLDVPIEIEPDTWRVLQLARRLHELTDGVFDPCLPDRPGSLRDVELGPGRKLVCHAPVAIDLGGIAKGYAIDRAVEKLIEHGCQAGLVNAGGDLRVFGEREEALLLRGADGSFRPLALKSSALAVSDIDASDRPAEHQGYYNRKGQTAGRRYAAVIAKDAATADGLTKCVLLCVPESADRAIRELQASMA